MFFYPKDSTPGCTKEACTFQGDLAKYKKAGAELIGISSDEDHSDFIAENNLSMTLLSDVGGKVSPKPHACSTNEIPVGFSSFFVLFMRGLQQ